MTRTIQEVRAERDHHLSIPENRINYAFHFLYNFSYEFVDYKKCYDSISKWTDQLDTSEAHY